MAPQEIPVCKQCSEDKLVDVVLICANCGKDHLESYLQIKSYVHDRNDEFKYIYYIICSEKCNLDYVQYLFNPSFKPSPYIEKFKKNQNTNKTALELIVRFEVFAP